MTVNIKLLSDVITWAAVDAGKAPHRAVTDRFKGWGTWDQSSWAYNPNAEDRAVEKLDVCGTAFCIAGQAAVQGGDMVLLMDVDGSSDNVAPRSEFPNLALGVTLVDDDVYVGPARSIDDYATEVLGLEDEGPLFNGDNSITDVVSYAMALAWKQDGVPLDLSEWVFDLFDREAAEEILGDEAEIEDMLRTYRIAAVV